MADMFDINDRSTWAWTTFRLDDVPESWADDGGYTINPSDPGSYIEFQDGVPHYMPCPAGLHFNPFANPGPVCDWPENIHLPALYDWAVKKGMIRDQRAK
jgi:hypothetical protein